MIFNLDERHSLKATVLESGKKCINWVSVGTFRDLNLTFKIKASDLKSVTY